MTLQTEFRKMPLQTEFMFTLPKGYVDEDGNVHRDGVMKLATAADEILPLKDPRVKSNPAYLSCIVLARTVTKIGTINNMTTKIIEDLFAADLAYLQVFYRQINSTGNARVPAICPKCETKFETGLDTQDG